MTRIGTPFFESWGAAERYYVQYGYSREDVTRKAAEGEIHIGRPDPKRYSPQGGSVLLDEDRRYHVEVSR